MLFSSITIPSLNKVLYLESCMYLNYICSKNNLSYLDIQDTKLYYFINQYALRYWRHYTAKSRLIMLPRSSI